MAFFVHRNVVAALQMAKYRIFGQISYQRGLQPPQPSPRLANDEQRIFTEQSATGLRLILDWVPN